MIMETRICRVTNSLKHKVLYVLILTRKKCKDFLKNNFSAIVKDSKAF